MPCRLMQDVAYFVGRVVEAITKPNHGLLDLDLLCDRAHISVGLLGLLLGYLVVLYPTAEGAQHYQALL